MNDFNHPGQQKPCQGVTIFGGIKIMLITGADQLYSGLMIPICLLIPSGIVSAITKQWPDLGTISNIEISTVSMSGLIHIAQNISAPGDFVLV